MAQLNHKLTDFWFDGEPSPDNFIKVRHRVLYGGRASSKSWEFAGMAAFLAANYKTRFLCVRRFQNKIKESVYSLIKGQIERFGIGGYDVQMANIYNSNGSDFSFYGIERNVDEIKSFEGADVLWIEEAHNLTKEQWDILSPTIRKEGSEIWISFNPRLVTDFVYERFILNTPPNSKVRLINYDENPFISNTMLEQIAAKRDEDEDEYQHIYKGVPNSDDDASVIKRSWVEAAVDAHINLGLDMSGRCNVGYDVADDGGDRNCAVRFNGSIAESLDAWKAGEDELSKSALRALSHVKQNGSLVYDSIGVGAHTGSTLNSAGFREHLKFNAADSVSFPTRNYAPDITNKEKFENLKAQAWQDVADRLRNTYNAVNKGEKFSASDMISISSEIENIDQLKAELCAPHKDYSRRGLDMVESKKDVKKRLERSHDLSDAFVMAACYHIAANKVKVTRPTIRIGY